MFVAEGQRHVYVSDNTSTLPRGKITRTVRYREVYSPNVYSLFSPQVNVEMTLQTYAVGHDRQRGQLPV